MSRMRFLRPQRIQRRPKKSNDPTSPPLPHRRLYALQVAHLMETRTKTARLAVLTGHFHPPTTRHRIREMGGEALLMSTIALTTITETARMIFHIYPAKQTCKLKVRTMATRRRRTSGGPRETTWLRMRSYWRGLDTDHL